MSIRKYVSPLCLAASASVRATSMHHFEYWAPLVQTFWPVIDPLVAVLDRARLQRGEVGPGVGLGEALAPDLLAGEDRGAGSAPSARVFPRPSAWGRRAAGRARWRERHPRAADLFEVDRGLGRGGRRARRTRSASSAPPSRRRTSAAASPGASGSARPRRPRWARRSEGSRRASRGSRRGRRSPVG